VSCTSTRRILKTIEVQPVTLVVASRSDLQRSTAKQAQSKSIKLPGRHAIFLPRKVEALIENAVATSGRDRRLVRFI
jgi:hypothetical protein